MSNTEYLDCECGSKKVYVSEYGRVCCSPCFYPLSEVSAPEKVDMTAFVVKDDDGWAVKVNGVTQEYFSKYEDSAPIDAMKLAIKLNAKGL